MLALVLGGGGAKGAYEMGVWKALIELDVEPDIAVGTSIGSMNAAFVVQGDYNKALEVWNTFDAGKMLGVADYANLDSTGKVLASAQIFAKDFIHEGGMEATEYKKAILRSIDENKVRASRIQYGAVTYDITNQKPIEKMLKDMRKGQLVDYIMASSAIIPAVKPYEIDGIKYIDGGFYDVVPINMALAMGAKDLIAVDLSAVGLTKKIKKPEQIHDFKYIRPYWDLGSVLIFEDATVQRNIQLGYYDTLKAFGAFDGRAYTFIKEKKIKAVEMNIKELIAKCGLDIERKRSKFSLATSIAENKWDTLSKLHTRLDGKKLNDVLLCMEIVAEILQIDPTKIYSVDSMDEKIREKLSKIKNSAYSKTGRTVAESLKKDLSTMVDERARLKYFALEIQKSLKSGQGVWMKKLAPVFTKEFAGGLYIALKGLL